MRDDRPFAGPAPPAALFHYSPDRKAEHPTRHLEGWRGILQADAYAGFNDLYAPDRHPGPVTEAGCWAHARRKFFDLAERGRAPLAVQAVRRVRRLPDPPIEGFDTKKVNTSNEAYSYGGPDSPINVLMHDANLVLATTDRADRARRHPWLPLLAAAVELPQSIVAAKYLFYQMPKVDRRWCPYCITDALTHFATLALVLPEAAKAARTLWARRGGA